MGFSIADQRRVFLACRPVFTGAHAQMRKEKAVRKVVLKRRQGLKQLFTDFGETKVVDILRHLLEKRIFESDYQAEAHFPELFCSSPAQNIQRAESESDAARSTAELLDEIESAEEQLEYSDTEDKTEPDHETTKTNGMNEVQNGFGVPEVGTVVLAGAEITASLPKETREFPCLYPLYFCYSTQHKILTMAQSALEESCFEFAEKRLPGVLAAHQWDCAAAVELTKWTKIFRQHRNQIPPEALTTASNASLSQILAETHRMRHAAVHRLPTTARETSKFVLAALQLSKTLQDHKRTALFDQLYHEVENQIKAMELHKNALEDHLRQDLGSIAAKRKELDQLERECIQRTLSDDHENKILVANLLEETVHKIFGSVAMEEDNFESCSEEESTRVPH